MTAIAISLVPPSEEGESPLLSSTLFNAEMQRQNAGLALKASNYVASSCGSYKEKLKKLVCYSVAGHFAPYGARLFKSLRVELDKVVNDSSSVGQSIRRQKTN